MKKIMYLGILLVITNLYACNDWLDVKPKTSLEREEYYSSEDGFQSALVGLYMKLKERGLYGEELTMTNLEFMAQHWIPISDAQQDLADFNWKTATSEKTLKDWYAKLYTVIAQANDLLVYLDKKGEVIADPDRRSMIRGEALAIRAFCHLDILRLFGQLPENDTITRNLPYSEQTGNKPVPFYDFDTYAQKVLRDFEEAAGLLKNVDPVVHYSFEALDSLSGGVEKGYLSDDFDAFRRVRFNYWAVKALQARAYLYVDDKDNAYTCAKEVIDAKVNGKPVVQLSFLEDIMADYYVLPSEVLLGLNIYNIDLYASELFRKSDNSLIYKSAEEAVITNDLFQGNTTDRRKAFLWTNVQGLSSSRWTIKKYWQTSPTADNAASASMDMKTRMVPLIRLAEVWLIAVETAPTLDEANRLFREFKASRDLEYTDQSREQIQVDLINEYRKELYAEGQMFFTYKRLGIQNMLWRSQKVSEGDYVLPIPKTEVEY